MSAIYLRDPSEVAAPPITVSAAQAKLALDDAGLYDTVRDMCLGHEVLAVRIYWESAQQWQEGHPVIQAMAAELELDDAAVRALFVAALQK